MNMLLATLKIIADYYPGRLHKAFVIDPPSLFSYLWKGMRPFVELSPFTSVVSSLDFEESLEFNDFTSYPRAASQRFDTASISSSSSKLGSCASSRFSFTVSHSFDSVKPWSHSFASPIARGPRGNFDVLRKGFFPSTPMPQKTQKVDPSMIHHPRTPKPSFLQSPALFFRKDYQVKDEASSRWTHFYRISTAQT
ncbi:hypothetical protein BUALT_Bualt14G0072900 [Buddleja alternifolia]|uniref:CRAL-TRIO domain-containing protein n=1 Tax=Buddleja alternifolia TaxID=168488 RepID=A0AAV6WIJ0_9LAMI|nr:hypothetical protein BUALT_Bualt14G0072900 [Buddleja alternifolia]